MDGQLQQKTLLAASKTLDRSAVEAAAISAATSSPETSPTGNGTEAYRGLYPDEKALAFLA